MRCQVPNCQVAVTAVNIAKTQPVRPHYCLRNRCECAPELENFALIGGVHLAQSWMRVVLKCD